MGPALLLKVMSGGTLNLGVALGERGALDICIFG